MIVVRIVSEEDDCFCKKYNEETGIVLSSDDGARKDQGPCSRVRTIEHVQHTCVDLSGVWKAALKLHVVLCD